MTIRHEAESWSSSWCVRRRPRLANMLIVFPSETLHTVYDRELRTAPCVRFSLGKPGACYRVRSIAEICAAGDTTVVDSTTGGTHTMTWQRNGGIRFRSTAFSLFYFMTTFSKTSRV